MRESPDTYESTDDGRFNDAEETKTCASIMVESPVPVAARGHTGDHHRQDLAWIGDSYGLVWEQNGTIRYKRMAPNGSTMGNETILIEEGTPPTFIANPRVAWTGSMVGVTWELIADTIQFQLLFPDGTPDGPCFAVNTDIVETLTGIQSSLAWTGEEFTVAWPYGESSSEGLMITSFTSTNTDGGRSLRLFEGFGGHPDIQGHDGQAAVVWGGEGIHFALVSADGTISGQSIISDPYFNNCRSAYLAVGASGFGAIWTLLYYDMEGFYFSALSFEGEPLAEPIRVDDTPSAPYSSDIAWGEVGYALVWVEDWAGPDEFSTMQVAIISDAGEIHAEEIITEDIGFWWVVDPHLAWTGSEFGLIWMSSENGLVLSRIHCIEE